MLAEKYPVDKLRTSLVDPWHPYPTVGERNQWDSLPDAIRSVYVKRGEDVLEFDWPSLQATRFLDYARTGNRSRFQGDRSGRRQALGHLVLAECAEGKGRFVDQIVNGVWATCEETYWGVPAHLSLQAAGKGLPDASEPTVDLFAAETSALLAWTHYLVGETFESVSPLICPRIEQEIDRRILTPLLDRDDFWWMGLKPRPDGRVTGSGRITFDQGTFTASTEEISLEGGERLHKIWGSRVVRISLTAAGFGTEASWTVSVTR
jgi:hypothetical protein